jgi:ligand-binding SRPBCC domain-containing protein
VRTGIVLSPAGGALEKMLPPFQLGIAGPLGNGKHWMSWIHIDDLVNIFIFALENLTINGAINSVAPGAVPNKDFTRVLAKVLGRPAFLPTPAFALKIIFGEMASILLGSQNVKPEKLTTAGFKFEHSELFEALDNLFRNRAETGNKIEQVLWIPKPVNEVFDFFSSPNNLERITPPWLNFKITKKSSENIVEGMLIDYKLRVHYMPIRWRTRIEEWAPGNHFIDRQLKGPYKLWYHEHSFEPLAGGTLIKDCVVYRLPFGILGDLVNAVWVKWDVAKIFSYRSKVISDIFGLSTAKAERPQQIAHMQSEKETQH